MSTHFSEPFDPSAWVSQAEAARLRGVTRQAIAKLVRKGRLRTLEVAGHTFVHKVDVESYVPMAAGRPPKSTEGSASE